MKINLCEKCGGKAKARHDGLWTVICTKCGEESLSWVYYKWAIENWNYNNQYSCANNQGIHQ